MPKLTRILDTCLWYADAEELFNELKDYGIVIPYEKVEKGKYRGKLKTLQPREKDYSDAAHMQVVFGRKFKEAFVDHINTFRTEDNRAVLTLSPYACEMITPIEGEFHPLLAEMREYIPDLKVISTCYAETSEYGILLSHHAIYLTIPAMCIWKL